ncbi:MAG TPA: PIN domain nuclease [Actinoplanes sp.]|nr:PIN domain nuclease [Actinoplanes sp.]
MALTSWLVDKSALVRMTASVDAEEWFDRTGRGLLRISTVTHLEMGFSARSVTEHLEVSRTPPISLMPLEYVTPAAERRAVEVQRTLTGHGRHRAASVPDLLLAAIAEVAGLTVLHLDKDFEIIADVTGQPVERLRLVGGD